MVPSQPSAPPPVSQPASLFNEVLALGSAATGFGPPWLPFAGVAVAEGVQNATGLWASFLNGVLPLSVSVSRTATSSVCPAVSVCVDPVSCTVNALQVFAGTESLSGVSVSPVMWLAEAGTAIANNI